MVALLAVFAGMFGMLFGLLQIKRCLDARRNRAFAYARVGRFGDHPLGADESEVEGLFDGFDDLDDDEDYDEPIKDSENLASNVDVIQEQDDIDDDMSDTNEQQEVIVNTTDAPSHTDASRPLKFYILNAPHFTSDLIGMTPIYNETISQIASNYYTNIADTN